jgi:nucleoside-diphosphate-sugar epimerase
MESDLPILLITGVNGYVGSWITKKALESKKYKVRGTVRDHKDKTKFEPLKEALGDLFDELELVSADLTDRDSIAKAVKGCQFVLHVASPFPASSPKDHDDVIKPAVNGTIAVLEACVDSTVKRVVTTSSCAAILDFSKGDAEYDETHWPEISKSTSAYVKSKILAEKASWDYIDILNEKEKTFDFCTVNPGLVVGPLLVKSTGTSQTIISSLLEGKYPSCPCAYLPFVDVRDVADAHLKALEAKPFERYALNTGTFKFGEIGTMINDNFSNMGYSVSHKDMYTATAWLAGFFDSDVASMYADWGIKVHVKNDKARKELGMEFIPVKDSIIEMCYSMMDHKLVEDKRPKDT